MADKDQKMTSKGGQRVACPLNAVSDDELFSDSSQSPNRSLNSPMECLDIRSQSSMSGASRASSVASVGRPRRSRSRSPSTSSEERFRIGERGMRKNLLWTTPPRPHLVDLLGYCFINGRIPSFRFIAAKLHNTVALKTTVATMRAFLLSSSFCSLNREQMSQMTEGLSAWNIFLRKYVYLEVLMKYMERSDLTHEYDQMHDWISELSKSQNYSDFLQTEPGIVAIMMSIYLAIHEIIEYGNATTQAEVGFTDGLEDALGKRRELIEKLSRTSLSYPNVVADPLLEHLERFYLINGGIPFRKLLKRYVRKNPDHLTGYLYYHADLKRRAVNEDILIKRLATIRKILKLSPTDEVIFEYADIIFDFEADADLQEIVDKFSLYLDYYHKKYCLKGWKYLCLALIFAKKYKHSITLGGRQFWFKYHFTLKSRYTRVDIWKAFYLCLIEKSEEMYVQSVKASFEAENNFLLKTLVDSLTDLSAVSASKYLRL